VSGERAGSVIDRGAEKARECDLGLHDVLKAEYRMCFAVTRTFRSYQQKA